MEAVRKEPSIGISIIPVLFLLGALLLTLVVYGLGEAHIAMFSSAMFAAVVAVFGLGMSWEELEKGAIESIKVAMGAIIILLIIGMLVGTWMISGIVPTMVSYGLQLISPGMFLAAACLICSVVSLATGSSWTACATVGIALMGVGEGLGIPTAMIGGAVISGSYFGDKMSPLSDTTNLAPAMTGSNLFEHIRHMLYTTGPSYVISIILFIFLGMKYSGQELDHDSIDTMLSGISSIFTISPLLLTAPFLVMILVIKRVPAIPGLFCGVVLGAIFTLLFQDVTIADTINAANNGFKSNVGDFAVDKLLSRGGMQSMLWTVSLIICALIYGGIMERSGMLYSIANALLSRAQSTGNFIAATVFTTLAMNFIASDQYLSIVIPGRMCKKAFAERGLHPKNLSRILEDAGTLVAPIIPWNTGVYNIPQLIIQ